MGLRDIGATLPPGFRFYPSDEELVCHYLYKKIANEEALKGTLVEIDLHTCEPWQLPEVAMLNSNEWYFFSFRDRKYATGYRTNRATQTGYWKATGKDRTVQDPQTKAIIGMRKTLVFYRNRAPNGIKTGWIMHEFRLENPHMPPKEDWVLCRVFHKSKAGENSGILGLNEDGFETVGSGAISPNNLATSPTNNNNISNNHDHQTTPCNCCHRHHQMNRTSLSQISQPNTSTALPNPPSAPSPGVFHLADHQERNIGLNIDPIMTRNPSGSNNKCDEDQYGFFFDMELEENDMVDGEPSGHMLEDDIKFNEGSLLFL